MLIVGDCVVAEDDTLWQSKEFARLCLDPAIDSQTGVPIPWFDPPLISPQPTVCAVPVSLTSLDYAFGVAFGPVKSSSSSSSRDSTSCSSGNKINSDSISSSGSGPAPSYLRGSTPLCGSSFSVLVYSSSESMFDASMRDLNGGTGRCPPVCPSFGPHDYCTFREFLLCDYKVNKRSQSKLDAAKELASEIGTLSTTTRLTAFTPRIVAEHFSLNFLWNFIIEVGCVDGQLFMDLRWVVLHAVLRQVSAARAALVASRIACTKRSNDPVLEDNTALYVDSESQRETGAEAERVVSSEVLEEVKRWCDVAVVCMRRHSSCSIAAVLRFRRQAARWLLALSSALRKESVQFRSHAEAATAILGIKECLSRSHLDDVLLRGSVYALQSLLSLHGAVELSEGLGLDPHQEMTAFPRNVTVPVPCHLQRYLSACQTVGPIAQSAIPHSHSDPTEDSMQRYALSPIHCLSEEEAEYCAAALLALIRTETLNPEFCIDQKTSSEITVSLILPLYGHAAAVISAKQSEDRGNQKMNHIRSDGLKNIAREKKTLRKVNRFIALHTDITAQ